jgi:hypothetical protein
MAKDDLDDCRRSISEQTRLALAAPCPEVAEKHHQLAVLYRGQLAVLLRGARAVAEQGSSLAAATSGIFAGARGRIAGRTPARPSTR